MIYVGYPCVGKSSICTAEHPECIDLESSNFSQAFNLENIQALHLAPSDGDEQKAVIKALCDSTWSMYINTAIDLESQGHDVFVSCHPEVITRLLQNAQPFTIIAPALSLKDEWIKRAQERFERDPSTKNQRALQRISEHFENDIKELGERLATNHITIETTEYDLHDIITVTKEDGLPLFKFFACPACKRHGTCGMATKLGCMRWTAGGEHDILCTYDFWKLHNFHLKKEEIIQHE